MPATNPDFLLTPVKPYISFGTEPVFNALNSLSLLSRTTHLGGLNSWVRESKNRLTTDQLATNELLFEGVPYAFMPDRSWAEMPAFLDHLAQTDPVKLRDNLLSNYASVPPIKPDAPPQPDQLDELLASKESFLQFLQSRFDAKYLNLEVESRAYDLLVEPEEMQRLILSHLRHMWQEVVAEEWERSQPMVADCVAAFAELDLSNLPPLEIARLVLGDAADEKWKHLNKEEKSAVFIPSPHIGPYVGKFFTEDTNYFVFGAHLPQGSAYHAPDLSRSELLVRLNALADDSRLRILALVAQEEEICAQEIIAQLELSQSAASRHLRQLTATGYLSERRKEGAKCYQINESRLGSTFSAMERFLTIG